MFASTCTCWSCIQVVSPLAAMGSTSVAPAKLATPAWREEGGWFKRAREGCSLRCKTGARDEMSNSWRRFLLLIPEFCPGGQRLTYGPTLSTNQMRPWD